MIGFKLETRAKAVETIVKQNLPSGYKAKLEPFAERISKRDMTFERYHSSSWHPKQSKIVEAHINIENEFGFQIAQVVVSPFGGGKPIVRFIDDNSQLADTLAAAIKNDGHYMFNLPIREDLVYPVLKYLESVGVDEKGVTSYRLTDSRY